jgi:hypothetical protein
MSSSQRLWPIARRILNATDKTNLEILATHTGQRIRDLDRTEKEPRVLVIDFFLSSPGVSSSLGTLLADRFSESLANSSRKIEMIDRKNFAEYLTQNWTTLEDLKNFPGCHYIGRELGQPELFWEACMNKTARLA